MRAPRWTCLAVVIGGLLTLVGFTPARADLIFFKDGFVVEGKVVRDGTTVFDPAGGAEWIPQGFYYIDDGGRRIFFSAKRAVDVQPKKYSLDDPIRLFGKHAGQSIRPIQRVDHYGKWNAKAQAVRSVSLTAGIGAKARDYPNFVQHIKTLTPTFVETHSGSGYSWQACYMMREFDPDEIRDVLIHTKNYFEITPKLTPAQVVERRWRLFRFFAHGPWPDMAEKELDSIAKDLPDQKAEVEKQRGFLEELKIESQYDAIDRAYRAGQHQRAQKLIKEFPSDDKVKNEKLLTAFRTLRQGYDEANKNLKLLHSLLDLLLQQVDNPEQKKFFGQAVKAIETEIGYEEVMPPLREGDKRLVGRLENFRKLAEVRFRNGQNPAEVLAFAVSGWLLGNASAEKTFKTSQRLWQARKLVQEYVTTDDPKDRQKILEAYRTKEGLSVEEFAYLISLLPPADPGDATPGSTVEFVTQGPNKVPYHLRLPTEYRHHRPYGYPVLFVLHDGSEKPQDALARWSDLAEQYGFILVAPRWTRGLQNQYVYSPAEQAAVLEVLRELRHQYAVDSDRVFVFGLGEGGTLAYDVGLSHPDQFAGILPMSAMVGDFIQNCAGNAQYLPIYAVCGDNSEQVAGLHRLFEPMGGGGYPTLLVIYRGRGPEWFSGEVPNAFEWMSHKVRANPIGELATKVGRHFVTARTTDGRFYWISADTIEDRCINQAAPHWGKGVGMASLQASIKEKNFLAIDSKGIKQLTIWFSGNGMVDFANPVRISINSGTPKEHKVIPSLATLLEDYRTYGDRQRLFLAKVQLDIK